MVRTGVADGPVSAAAPPASAILRIALGVLAAPKRIIGVAALVMLVCAIFGLPVINTLSAGGFTDPASESVRAADILASKFGQSDVQLLVTVTADGGVHSVAAAEVAADILTVLKSSPDVIGVTSLWQAHAGRGAP
jgi:RND superfamily putative drug exporter